jgi:hypothetical protein
MLPPLIRVELERLVEEAGTLKRRLVGNPAARAQLAANVRRQLQIGAASR